MWLFCAVKSMTTAVVQKLHVLVLLHQVTFLSEAKHFVTVHPSQDGSVTWFLEEKGEVLMGKEI
jgi:hypothetical protein